jgi:hypothetical protein
VLEVDSKREAAREIASLTEHFMSNQEKRKVA